MGGLLEFAAAEQRLKASAGFYKCFLTMFRQALDIAFNFQSPASMARPLYENQCKRTATFEIFCTLAALMFGNSAVNICGDAGIQAAIPTSQHVHKPIICFLHEHS